jgi:hypothetical protein
MEGLAEKMPYVLLAILIFVGMRYVILWYYKIDEQLAEFKKTNELLEKIACKLGVNLVEEIKDDTEIKDFIDKNLQK